MKARRRARTCGRLNLSYFGDALPDYEDWWRIWEEQGWTSLGRVRNFDWMHVQATKP